MTKSTSLLTPPVENRDVARELIRLIQADGLTVGDRLPSIRQLAETLQTSGSVVRDSLMKVQTMGLVKILPRSGAFVQALDYAPLVNALSDTIEGEVMRVDHNLFHLLRARQLLEVDSVGEAARRRRLEDLLPIREALGDMLNVPSEVVSYEAGDVGSMATPPQFVEGDIRFHLGIAQVAGNPVLVTMLRALLGLLRPYLARIPWSSQREATTRRSHVAIYESLVDGDVDRARESMHEHLQLAYGSLLDQVRSAPSSKATRLDLDE